MIRFAFCSLLAYRFPSTERRAADACLSRLIQQLSLCDAFLSVEAPWQDRLKAWTTKPSVLQSALSLNPSFAILVDCDVLFRDDFLARLASFLDPIDPDEPFLSATVTHGICGETPPAISKEMPSEVIARLRMSGIADLTPSFWVSASLVIASRGARPFVNRWAALAANLTGPADESSLIALLHQSDRDPLVRFVPTPPSLHSLYLGDVRFPDAAAVSLSANLDPQVWFRLAFSPDGLFIGRR
ncbi:MAG: hypothetical protein NZ959_10360 [Armatimonadetes bacterium]|nr:hypothetical protein [Armatimonadota bacterium]